MFCCVWVGCWLFVIIVLFCVNSVVMIILLLVVCCCWHLRADSNCVA